MARRLRCPGCMRRYRSQDIAPLEDNARSGAFRLSCPMCHSQRLVLAVWTRNAMRTFVTDLDAEEWMHYRAAPPISSDDVLRFHAMLLDYDGDFSDVLEDPLFDDADE